MRGVQKSYLYAILFISSLYTGTVANAHELGVLKVYLDADDAGQYTLRTQMNGVRPEYFPAPILPSGCTSKMEISGSWIMYRIMCESERLDPTGMILLPWQREGALVFATWQNGLTSNHFFTRSNQGIEIHLQALHAPGSTGLRVAGKYTVLGVQHILMGIDHLLFVIGLLMLVSGKWMLVRTITSFTVAHSITLGLAVYNVFWLSNTIVDALIALSITFVAVEVIHALRGHRGLSQKAPWTIAFLFGLLHGLGFAGALKALDLPRQDLPLALFSFNIGVEAGQLIFIGAFFLTIWSVRQVKIRLPAWSKTAAAYAIGTAATYWFIARVDVLIGYWRIP